MKALLASCFAALAVVAAPALADKKKQAVDDEDPLSGTAKKPDKAEKKKPKVEYVEDTPAPKKADKADKDKPKKAAKPEYVDDDARPKAKADDKKPDKSAKADDKKPPKADDKKPGKSAGKADDKKPGKARTDDAAARKLSAEEAEAAKQQKIDEELAALLKKTKAEEAAAKKADTKTNTKADKKADDRAKKAKGGDVKAKADEETARKADDDRAKKPGKSKGEELAKKKADEERARNAEIEAKKAIEEREKAQALARKKAQDKKKPANADDATRKPARADDDAATTAAVKRDLESAKSGAKAGVKKGDRKAPASTEPDEIELDPVVMTDDSALASTTTTAAAPAELSVTRRRAAKSSMKRLYVRAGVAHVAPLADSREMELADVDGAASLAVQNGPIAGSGASVSSATIPALIVGYKVTPRISVETILGLPFTVKFKATGTLANESIAPMALGIPTGVPALGSELGEAKAAPPTVTATYALASKGPIVPYVGAGLAVLFAFDAKVTNPLLTEVSQPEFIVKPAPGLVLQTGAEAKLWKNVYARLDVKFIAGMLARAEAKHIQVRTPELPLFDTVEVGTARMSVWVNPLIVQAGIGADF